MIEILYFIPILLICFGLGKKIFNILNISFKSFLEESIFSIALGLGIIAYLTLGLGLLGFLYSWLFYLIFIIFLIIFFKEIISFLKKIYYSYKKCPKLKFNLDSILAIILFIFIMLNLFATMAPPWAIDVLIYHMAVPKLYVIEHSIHYIPSILNSNLPFTIEMLYTVGLLLKNEVLSKLFIFSFGLLTVLAIFSFSKRYFSKRVALFSALIFYTLPLVMENVTIGMVDIGFSFFSFLAFYALINWFKKSKNWILVSAIFAGLAAGTKFHGLYYLFFLTLIILYKNLFKDLSIKTFLTNAFYFNLIALIIASPWYIKSFIWTGNPVFPLMYSIFGGKYFTARLAESFSNRIMGYGVKGFLGFLLLPWKLTMHGILFKGFMGIGQIFLAFIPLLLFLKKVKPLIKYILLYTLVLMIAWFFGPQIMRYQFLAWILLSIVAAYSINTLLKTKIRFIILLFLISSLAFNSALWYGINSKQLPIAFGLESEEQFYTKLKNNNDYMQFQWINANIPKDSKIFFFKKIRGYFSEIDYVSGNPDNQAYVDYSKIQKVENLYDRLKEIGITHIMVNTRLFDDDYIKRKDSHYDYALNLMDGLIDNNSTLIYENDGTFLYKLG